MSYSAYSPPGGYVGDVASNNGWMEFRRYCESQKFGEEINYLLTYGVSNSGKELADELKALKPAQFPPTESTRANMIALAASVGDAPFCISFEGPEDDGALEEMTAALRDRSR